MPKAKLHTLGHRLLQFGIDLARADDALDANDEEMKRWAAACPVPRIAYAYDMTYILGFAKVRDPSLPRPSRGLVTVKYGGWSMVELQQKLLSIHGSASFYYCATEWFFKERWANEKLPKGIYRLQLPLPASNLKGLESQMKMIPSGKKIAPAVLVASAVFSHRLETGESLLGAGNAIRCEEVTHRSKNVLIGDWDEHTKIHISERGHAKEPHAKIFTATVSDVQY